MVNYLHEILVISPSICTSYSMSVVAPVHVSSIPSICTLYVPSICTLCVISVIAPICALSIEHIYTSCDMSVIAAVCTSSEPSIHPSHDKCQEFLDEFPGTNYGEKNLSKITAKIPDDITLTLCQVKFLEATPGTTNGVKYPATFQ